MNEPLSKEQLDAVRARADAATPGPWEWQGDSLITLDDTASRYGPTGRCVLAFDRGDSMTLSGLVRNEHVSNLEDAEFIAAARADIPALLAHIDALQDELDRWHAEWHEKRWFLPWARELEEQGRMAARGEDAEFIAYARAEIPALLATIGAQAAEIARLRALRQRVDEAEIALLSDNNDETIPTRAVRNNFAYIWQGQDDPRLAAVSSEDAP